MKEYLKKFPKELRDLIGVARDIAATNNIPVYLVGGCVRDLLLGVKNLDLDIVVEGNGINFAQDLTRILKARLIRHRRFGTATVVLRPNLKVDIATARKEFYPQPASLPEVISGTLKDDLARRDFTINAMAIKITGRNFSGLIDLFNGKDDLRHKKIRALHNLSFIDDPTRILRAIRFEKRYDFKIDSGTLKNLKEAVRLKMLDKVQPQRLRDELVLILKEEYPLKQIRRIQELTGFSFLFPKLYLTPETYKLLSSIEKQIRWFKRIYPRSRQLHTWLIYFMGLMDSLNNNAARSISKKFVFRKGEEKIILSSKKVDPGFIRKLCGDKITPSRVFNLLEPLSYEVILLLKAKFKNRNLQRHIEDFLKIYNAMRISISGDDLHRLGLAPGPVYQSIFTKVLNARLQGKVHSKEEELALAKRVIKYR